MLTGLPWGCGAHRAAVGLWGPGPHKKHGRGLPSAGRRERLRGEMSPHFQPKCLLIYSLNLPWCNSRPFPLVLHFGARP